MRIFFRADDIGWDHAQFERLAALFVRHGAKFNGAAIPLTCRQGRLDLARFAGHLEIHSHGFAHLDHESAGKKSEFGDSRPAQDVLSDFVRSREILEGLFPALYYPAFVPPWNRMSVRFLPLLAEAGYRALSRDGRPRADVPGLREINVSVDLHTSRIPGPATPEELMARLEREEAAGAAAGVMLHHAKMSDADYGFLDAFLGLLRERAVETAFFSEMAAA